MQFDALGGTRTHDLPRRSLPPDLRGIIGYRVYRTATVFADFEKIHPTV